MPNHEADISRMKEREKDSQHQGRTGGKVPILPGYGQAGNNPKQSGGINRSTKKGNSFGSAPGRT